MYTIRKALFLTLIFIGIISEAQNRSVSVISQNNSSVVLDFTLSNYSVIDTLLNPNYNVNQTFSYIQIDDIGYGISDSIGRPQMPQLTTNICLPYNATNITVEFIPADDVTFVIPHQIMPRQENVFKDSLFVYNYSMDTAFYSISSWLYSSKVNITDEFNVFGLRGISLTICPFSYMPSNSLVNACLSGRITISFSLDDRIEESPRRYTETTENYLDNLFVNYSARNYNLSKERYLMIVNPSYKSVLNRFANYKINAGYDVLIVTTQETGSTAGSIKSYIQDLYDNINTRPEYILLAGDVNTIPASAGSDGIESDPITDLDYSRLDGDDYYADVYLGRFPICSNNQLENIINKTIYTETNLPYLYDIAYLIAAKTDAFREKILSNISAGRRAEVRAQEDILKPMRRSDCERITSEFFSKLRRAFEEGHLIIKDRNDDVFV